MKGNFRWGIALVGVLFLLGGIGFYISEQALQAGAANWPTAQGRVTATDVQQVSTRGANRYVPRVSYTYVVGGQTYRADRVWLTDETKWEDQDKAVAWLNRYPIGGPVTVHHDPADPQNAALILTRTSSGKWLAGAGFGLIVLVYELFTGLRRRRRSR